VAVPALCASGCGVRPRAAPPARRLCQPCLRAHASPPMQPLRGCVPRRLGQPAASCSARGADRRGAPPQTLDEVLDQMTRYNVLPSLIRYWTDNNAGPIIPPEYMHREVIKGSLAPVGRFGSPLATRTNVSTLHLYGAGLGSLADWQARARGPRAPPRLAWLRAHAGDGGGACLGAGAGAQSRRRSGACAGGWAAGCLVLGREGAGSPRRVVASGRRTHALLWCTRALLRACCWRARGSRRGAVRGSSGARLCQRQRCRRAQVRAVQGALWDAYAEIAIYMEVLQVAAAPPPGRGGVLPLRAASARGPGSACASQHAGGPACWAQPQPRGCCLACRACMHPSAAPGRRADAGGEHCQLVAACCCCRRGRGCPQRSRVCAKFGRGLVAWSGGVCSRAPSRHARARSAASGSDTLQQDARERTLCTEGLSCGRARQARRTRTTRRRSAGCARAPAATARPAGSRCWGRRSRSRSRTTTSTWWCWRASSRCGAAPAVHPPAGQARAGGGAPGRDGAARAQLSQPSLPGRRSAARPVACRRRRSGCMASGRRCCVTCQDVRSPARAPPARRPATDVHVLVRLPLPARKADGVGRPARSGSGRC